MPADRSAPSGPKPGASASAISVALLGNPNTGKSCIFSALCGIRQRTGNYAGVTVEEKLGETVFGGHRFTLMDLPGTYSLSAISLDEAVTVDALLGRREHVSAPQVLLCVVDATNLSRNLYLVSQALELGLPIVVALNKTDLAEESGIRLDAQELSRRLGVAVVPTQAHRAAGMDHLREELLAAVRRSAPERQDPFPEVFRQEEQTLASRIRDQAGQPDVPGFLLRRLLLDRDGYLEQAEPPLITPAVRTAVEEARTRLAAAGHPVPEVEPICRYRWAQQVLEGCEQRRACEPTGFSDRLDSLLMHRVWGTLIFALLMVLVFQSIFAWAAPLMQALDRGVSYVGNAVSGLLPAGAFQSLVVDGVIAGVGSVLTFLPQILMLFLFIALLEDCGYMARAAYLMDKLMSRVGLSGKSFIPLLSSFACAIPGILATRVIEDRRDRLVTILVSPLMSCSARLPVYALLTAAFIPPRTWLGGWIGLQGLTMTAMYALGVIAAVVVALVLKRTVLPGKTPAFVMELPAYKIPSLRNVTGRVLDSGWSFVQTAGTLIVAVSIVIWAAAYFPRNERVAQEVQQRYAERLAELDREIQAVEPPVGDAATPPRIETLQAQRSELENRMGSEIAGAQLEDSLLGHAGKWIAPVVRPLGWDWRIGCAVVASFSAREVVVGTLGVIYQLGEGQNEQSESLQATLQDATWPDGRTPIFTVPVALSLMVFYSLCAQCAATLAVIRRETNSWRWPVFTFAYMTILAYVGALLTYQVGAWWLGT